ncbi:MAG: LAGLIDADG family homing endonuclease [bacterium]|nr:LAGLIDADG family homing endonuclease [bacterium]
MKANTVGKMTVEVKRAYLAGLIDGDGCIMATIERHSEKKFGFRVRVEMKLTQKESYLLESLARESKIGCVSCNNKLSTEYATYDWIVRDKSDLVSILEYIKPYTRLKKKQIDIALTILRKVIVTKQDLITNARLADTLSKFNVRSKNRRKNFAAMIETHISPND